MNRISIKRNSLVFGLFLLMASFSAQGQITTKYEQSFEPGETYGYRCIGGTASAVSMPSAPSGSNVLFMQHGAAASVVMLDTIDFTENSSYSYFVLSFMHVNSTNPLECRSASEVGVVEVKRPDQPETGWVRLSGSYYDRAWGGGSSDYAGTSSFSNRSYDLWGTLTGNSSSYPSNAWKGERFNLNNLFQGVPLVNRKLQVRFTLNARSTGTANDNGWYIDGITVKVSPMSMAVPILTMVSYPDLVKYPTSRGTRIDGVATTTVQQGLSADSMYILYRYGNYGDIRRTPFRAVQGSQNLYRGYIPFCGYDTMVYYRVVVKDATTNHNAATFPMADGAWERYRNVRGSECNEPFEVGSWPTQTLFPFPHEGDNRSQMFYLKGNLRWRGYGPGAMTGLTFKVGTTARATISRFQIKMRNVDAEFTQGSNFYGDDMKVVYDDALTLNTASGSYMTLNFQDTFFYAGESLLIMFSSNQTPENTSATNPPAIAVEALRIGNQNKTLYANYDATWGFNPFDAGSAQMYGPSAAVYDTNLLPNFAFNSHANLPLLHDCGVSGFITPNDSTPGTALAENSVTVTLKNYGAMPLSNVRLWYQIDNTAARYYDWSGTLAANATTNVTLYTHQNYTAGYHIITAWVDDTVTSGGQRYRDHEPLNDTLKSRFIACAGPISGQRQVGGTNGDYDTLEHMLYALSQCGVNGPLTVKLAPGNYPASVFPRIAGLSTRNYIQFESLDGSDNSVRFVARGNETSLVDLQKVAHIRFKNIRFIHPSGTPNTMSYLVGMNRNSVDVRFDNCYFLDSVSPQSSVSLYSSGADSLRVTGCTFYQGGLGVSIVGPASDNPAIGNYVFGSTFINQVNSAMQVRNQYNVVIDSNTMNDVSTNTSYIILLQDCSGARLKVTRNRFYSTNGAGCLGVTGVTGMMSGSAIIANNMIVCEDNGRSNLLTIPMNVISAQYVKVVYNSVKLVAPSRNGIAAVSFGGALVNHCDFYNNVVTCYDRNNFALNYTPNTTAGASNNIGYNIYYSTSSTMNRYSGTGCATLADWNSIFSGDRTSLSGDPHFLSATPTDLRSYDDIVKNHGTPVSGVTDDLFGTERHTTAPCIGAFEFVALRYDFEVSALIEPLSDYCNVPSSAPLRFAVRNRGTQNFEPGTSGTLTVYYSRNGRGTLSPTNSGTITINRTVPAGDTIIVTAPNQVQFPVNGTYDSTYMFYFWTVSALDPNEANDTVSFPVTAHYHATALTPVNQNVNYGTSATVNITGGLTSWYPHIYTSGRRSPSTVYWYSSPAATTPFYRGNSYTTPVLYDDTTFWIRQKRDMAMIKIAEVQFNRTGTGVTTPMPTWMNTNTTMAVELINVGDYPADIEGDTLQLVGQVAQVTVMPHLVIQPGQSVVVQYRAGITTPDSLVTFGAGVTKSANWNGNFGVLYRDGLGVADAVAFNSGNTQSGWTSARVPAAAWSGNGVAMVNGSAGAYRLALPGNPSATPSNSAQYWQVADATHPMTIGTTNSNLVYFTDNGCEGDLSTVTLTVTNRPTVDLTVDSLVLPNGCGLDNETISVTVNNFGMQTSPAYRLRFSVNGTQVGNESISTGVPSGGSVRHTFSTPANLRAATADVNYVVKVWVDHLSGDYNVNNDTVTTTTLSKYTPSQPNVASPQNVNYGNDLTLTPSGTVRDTIVWYDKNMNVIDTAVSYNTGHLYLNDTFYVGGIAATINDMHIGTLATIAAVTDNTSPYYAKQKYAREQFIITAAELIAAGHGAGPIKSLAFYVENVNAGGSSITFDNYTISLAQIPSVTTSFASNAWNTTAMTECFRSTNITLTSSDATSWKRHEFPQPFYWDGTSNILVQVCHSMATANTTSGQGVTTRYTQPTTTNTMVVAVNANTNPCDASSTLTPSRVNKRPDVQFGFLDYGCVGPTKQVVVNVTGTPAVDGDISWPAGSDTAVYTSCSAIPLTATLTNNGTNAVTSYTLNCWIDGVQQNTISNTTNLSRSQSTSVTLASMRFTPGRHTIKAILTVPGDQQHTNDTIERTINVRFCAGVYTIGASGNYSNFTTAIDTLNHAGVAGPVVFNVQAGTYNEQIELGWVDGVSTNNTVTFRSANNDSTSVVLRYAPTDAAGNYVMSLNGAAYYNFQSITFYSASTATAPANMFSNVVKIDNSEHITFRNCLIKVKPSLYFANANPQQQVNACGVVVGDDVTYLTFENNSFDSAYYAVRSNIVVEGSSHHITFTNNEIRHFWVMGIQLRRASNVTIIGNIIQSGLTVSGKPLHGIYLAQHSGCADIESNKIILVDNASGGKRGIYMSQCNATSNVRSKLYNNMVSVSGAGVASLVSSAIWIDSSTFVNVYFNTTYLYAGANANTTRSFSVALPSSDVQVLNNIFSNFSCGYSYYVQSAANVSTTNYNNYYSSTPASGAGKFAYWGADKVDLAALRSANGQDPNSMEIRPYFINESDLHLAVGSFVELGQYNGDVQYDIDGNIRPQIPGPTIGAHEFARATHDLSFLEVREPYMPANINNPIHIESDSVRVIVMIYNNGTAIENNVPWYAEVVGCSACTSSVKTISQIASSSSCIDTVMIPTILGVMDTQLVRLHMQLDTQDITFDTLIFLAPAYNLRAQTTSVSGGCNLVAAPVQITVRNEGKKAFPVNIPITIGYEATLTTNGVTVPNLPQTHVEQYTLTQPLMPNATETFTFFTPVDIYPHGVDQNITVRMRSWASYIYDLHEENDTTNLTGNINSYYRPQAPVVNDMTIPYSTWDTIHATQANNLAILWFDDSTQTHFYTHSNVALSWRWKTPQLFQNATYYLASRTAQNCTSYFSPVTVRVAASVDYDAAVKSVLAPYNKVYMVDDTVKVSIINYGLQPFSNIPVTYQLRRAGNPTPLQTVTETCPMTVQPGDTVVYTFDSLLQLPNAISAAASYTIKAWTSLPNEMTPMNDTMMTDYEFSTLAQTTYCAPTLQNSDGMDITRVSYSTLDNSIRAGGYKYVNFGDIAALDPGVPALKVTRGTVDTLTVEFENSLNSADDTTSGYLTVFVDYNRDGVFDNTEIITHSRVIALHPYHYLYTVPNNALYGYMRMRVVLQEFASAPASGCPTFSSGHVQDYLLYVEGNPKPLDLAIGRIVAPRSAIFSTDSHAVSFMLVNNGSQPVTSADIYYKYVDGDPGPSDFGSKTWQGNLQPGHSTLVTLDTHSFSRGTTDMCIYLRDLADADTTNDSTWYQYHLFETVTLILYDDFEGRDRWYAPRGYNRYTENYWERGEPHKSTINSAVSGTKVWATSINSTITPGNRGNVSLLYSPIIDISQIRPDTLVFWIKKSIGSNSALTLEYTNWQGNWEVLGSSSDTLWYDDNDGFTGSSSRYIVRKLSTDGYTFPSHMQFRFVFRSQIGASACDGVAIDDFKVGRARRAVDVGVTNIIQPTRPQLGQVISPRVSIHNYGYDTLHSVTLCYTHYGANLPKYGTFTGTLPPDGSVTYTFSTPFTVTSEFPDTFEICAFTKMSADWYWDNDSTCKSFTLTPLDDDISLVEFLTPTDRVVGGDSITVTVRMRNFGQNPISSTQVSYIFNGGRTVTETVNFSNLLGRSLSSMEYYNYTFRTKAKTSMGSMSIKAFTAMQGDMYLHNDTITKRISGIGAITDLKAHEIVIDGNNNVELVIANVGARGANNFMVGYWYNNDPTTAVVETHYRAEPLAALNNGYHVFGTRLSGSADRSTVKAFVHIDGDNDNSNDTTNVIASQYVDIKAIKVQLEENRGDNCRARIQIQNMGNMICTKQINLQAIINGVTLSATTQVRGTIRQIEPGRTYFIELGGTVSKSSSRSYQGTGYVNVNGDSNRENDQTSVIEVVNLFEDIPAVQGGVTPVLEQNYPNPYEHSTRIDFYTPEAGSVRFFVVDDMGRMVYQQTKHYNAGNHSIDFADPKLSAGVYYYGIECNGQRLMRKMVYAR